MILAAEFSYCGTNGGKDKIFGAVYHRSPPGSSTCGWPMGCLAGGREGGVGLRDSENNGPSAESALSLRFTLSATLAVFSPRQIWPTSGSFLLWRENTHTYIDTYTKKERRKSVGVGRIVGRKKSVALLSVQMWRLFFTVSDLNKKKLILKVIYFGICV